MIIALDKDVKRFFSKVYRDPDTGCWEWIGSINNRGYGVFSVSNYWVMAHRFIWSWIHEPIGRKLEIDHVCRNNSCVNPSHLEVVSHSTNIVRGMRYQSCYVKKLQ